MRVGPALVAGLAATAFGLAAESGAAGPELRFGWKAGDSATVELTDERRIGDTGRSSVMAMRMTVAPDGASDRLVLRFSDRRAISGDDASLGAAVARVLARATPSFAVSPAGDFVEGRDLDGTVREVVEASGFPAMPPMLGPFRDLIADLAAEDWYAWVGLWRGPRLDPGEWVQNETEMSFHGRPVRVALTRRGLAPPSDVSRVRVEAVVVYPSDAVQSYTSGLLLDLAIEAKELGDDPEVNERFIRRATFGPVTERLTVELEAATMRPIVVERDRAFWAVAGRHRVDGRERRVHRFDWADADPATAPR